MTNDPNFRTLNSVYPIEIKYNMSIEQNPGWLGYIGDYTTQLCWGYNKP